MPHIEIEGTEFDIPRPEDIAPEDLVPKTPRRPQQPPLQAREKKEKRGLGLDTISLRAWEPSADVEAAMDELVGGMLPEQQQQ